MNTPLLIWACVAIVMIAMFAIRLFHAAQHSVRPQHRFIEIGSEREEIWIPGDPLKSTQDFDDDLD